MYLYNYQTTVKTNANFRTVLNTGEYGQVVAMCLPAGIDIGAETHETTDQIFLFVEGGGEATVAGETKAVEAGDMLFVPAGVLHNIVNNSSRDLKLLTVYCPPNHPEGTVHATKAEAVAAEAGESIGESRVADAELDGALPDWDSTP